jgi:retrotransposon gag protein
MYNPWRYEIDAKFETDWPLFTSERSKVNYTLTEMDNPVFDAMQGWVMDMGGSVSLADLMDELEHYLGVHLQTKEAKRELLSIKQQLNESVTEYHQRLQRLWHRARTDEDERIEKFKITMLPSLSSSLLAKNYTRVRDLLDDARQVEDLKKDILHHHPRDRPRRSATQVFGVNRDSTLLTSRGITPPAPASTRPTAARHAPGSAAPTPTSKKPNGWAGPWYDPVANPKRMDDTEKERMIRQGRCWSCRGSGHRSTDDCCPMHSLRGKRLHALSTGDLIELDSSEDEKAVKA